MERSVKQIGGLWGEIHSKFPRSSPKNRLVWRAVSILWRALLPEWRAVGGSVVRSSPKVAGKI
jgi:hypothetical protein